MTTVSEKEFSEFLNRRPLAIADGFKVLGSYLQTRWFENGEEVARRSQDSFGSIHEVEEVKP
jgi:hypothetical protein